MPGGDKNVGGKLAGLRVLIAEDEYFLANDIARALVGAGAKIVGPVPKLDAALDLLARLDDIDGAVLDINLRGEAVYPLAHELRLKKIPFCFATGYDAGSLPLEYRDVPRWTKPLDIAAFVASLADMFSPSKAQLH